MTNEQAIELLEGKLRTAKARISLVEVKSFKEDEQIQILSREIELYEKCIETLKKTEGTEN